MVVQICQFMELALGDFVCEGIATKQPQDPTGNFQPPEHPLQYNNVPALIERLKLFLAYKAGLTPGRSGKQACISANTVQAWENTIIWAMQHHNKEHKTLDMVISALKWVFTANPSGSEGLFMQLDMQANTLITKLWLPRNIKHLSKYGTPEVKLIHNNIMERLATGGNAVALLQQMALVLLCFTTGLHPL